MNRLSRRAAHARRHDKTPKLLLRRSLPFLIKDMANGVPYETRVLIPEGFVPRCVVLSTPSREDFTLTGATVVNGHLVLGVVNGRTETRDFRGYVTTDPKPVERDWRGCANVKSGHWCACEDGHVGACDWRTL